MRLYDYWRGKGGCVDMPALGDIDPLEIHSILPYVILLDVEPEPLRFRYRLAGTGVVARHGSDPTGKYVDDANLRNAKQTTIAILKKVATSGHPNQTFGEMVQKDLTPETFERLVLPLSSDGETVTNIMVGVQYDEERQFAPKFGPAVPTGA